MYNFKKIKKKGAKKVWVGSKTIFLQIIFFFERKSLKKYLEKNKLYLKHFKLNPSADLNFFY